MLETVQTQCSQCDTTHTIVLNEQQMTKGATFEVPCSDGDHEFSVVIPPEDDVNSDPPSEDIPENTELEAEVINTTVVTDPSSPYGGSNSDVSIKECIDATVNVEGEDYSFRIWHTSDDGQPYVVRVKLSSGAKRKNVYLFSDPPYANELAFTDRGVPRNSDKQWTYLSLEECKRRAKVAGLAGAESAAEIEETGLNPDRDWVWIGEEKQSLMSHGSPEEEFLLKLAKGVLVFQTDKF